MSGAEVLDIGREAIWTLLIVVGPVMMVGLLVGVAIALVQALTQVQEMTLVFVPKILAIFVALLLTMPLMGEALNAFMIRIIGLIGQT